MTPLDGHNQTNHFPEVDFHDVIDSRKGKEGQAGFTPNVKTQKLIGPVNESSIHNFPSQLSLSYAGQWIVRILSLHLLLYVVKEGESDVERDSRFIHLVTSLVTALPRHFGTCLR